jgi:hypothetical protein
MADTGLTARLSCGCEVGFEAGVEGSGSPVTVVLRRKSAACSLPIHVAGIPLYDHREALRPATTPIPQIQPDFEEG